MVAAHRGRTHPGEQLEVDLPARLPLRDGGSRSHGTAADELSDPDFHHVTASQLAVDGQVEQRTVAETPFSIEGSPHDLFKIIR